MQRSDLKIGQWVEYTDGLRGRIKSWNDVWIFVVYHCDDKWDFFNAYTGCATSIDDLTLIEEPEE